MRLDTSSPLRKLLPIRKAHLSPERERSEIRCAQTEPINRLDPQGKPLSHPQSAFSDATTVGSCKRLPPRRPEDHTLFLLLTSGVGLIASLTILAFSIWAGVIVYHSAAPGLLYADDCEGKTASDIQRRFLINIRLAQNLSFPEAKLIDLAWDTFVGHGGRLLHGWALYHVAARILTFIMESSAVPCHVQINLLFDTVSFQSIWSCISYIHHKKPVRTTLFLLWIVFAITYVFAYPTIWSAATGYMSPSIPVYTLPGQTYTKDYFTDLNFCWAFDSTRMPPNTPDVVMGPSIGDVIGGGLSTDTATANLTPLDFLDNSWEVWTLLNNKLTSSDPGASINFLELYACGNSCPTLLTIGRILIEILQMQLAKPWSRRSLIMERYLQSIETTCTLSTQSAICME